MGSMDLEAKYSEILIQNGILDEISKVEAFDPELTGEQFGSICELVKVQFKDEKRADCNFFVKKILPIPDPIQLQFFEAAMLKEGFFLTTFVQDMKNYCIKKTGNNEIGVDKLFPKTYHSDKEAIVMDNLALQLQGYVMLDKDEKQDFEHAKLVMESMAKFQAVSHVLVLEEGGLDPFIKKYPTFNDDAMTNPDLMAQMSVMLSPAFEMMLEILKVSSIPGSYETYSKLSGYSGKWLEYLIQIIMESLKSKVLVTNHGDCWNNNMLFNEKTPNPEELKVVLLDVANGRMGSPCLDIGYYIFTSVKADVRKQWKDLLRIYFDKFREVCQALGVTPTVTFDEFVVEYQGQCKFGLLMGMFMGFGMSAMKEMDTKDGFFMNNLSATIAVWVEKNEEKVQGIVTHIIQLVNDYLEISIL